MKYKKGYLLKIHTWENDGDNPNIKEIVGLCKQEVECYVKILNLFKSINGSIGKFGNIKFGSELNEDNLYEEIKNILTGYPDISGHIRTYPDINILLEYLGGTIVTDEQDLKECYYDYFTNEVIGHWGEGQYSRVLEKIEVFHVEVPPKNVTHAFV